MKSQGRGAAEKVSCAIFLHESHEQKIVKSLSIEKIQLTRQRSNTAGYQQIRGISAAKGRRKRAA